MSIYVWQIELSSFMTPRQSILALFWPIAVLSAIGQNGWVYTDLDGNRHSRVLDIIEMPSGFMITSFKYDLTSQSGGAATIARLDQNGTPGSMKQIWPQWTSIAVQELLPLSGGERIMAVGAAREVSQQGYLFSHVLDQDLNTIDSTAYLSLSSYNTFMDNATVTSQGDIFLVGSGRSSAGAVWDRAMILRVNSNGDLLGEYAFSSGDLLIARDVLQFADDSILVAMMGVPSGWFQDWSWASYLKFNRDLEPGGGFLSQASDGSGAPLTFQNAIADVMHMEQIASGNLIVSGRPRGEGLRTVVIKLSTDGDWLGSFHPASDYPQDHPAAYGAIALSDEHLFVASMENFFEGQMVGTYFLPDHPNQVSIFKLDTALNIVCENIVDGYSENVYYWVDRIRATTDGGYILVGGRFDLNATQPRMAAWAQKFGPEDCFVGLKETVQVNYSVFPNPGEDQFSFTINGSLPSALLTLFDANGRAMGNSQLKNNKVDMDTSDLPPGLYTFRLIDGASGQHIASGRWIKAP